MELEIHPLTPDRWRDLEALFGPRGACGGCWCMLERLSRKQFEALKGEGARLALKSLVDSGEPPGLLGYYQSAPIGWCSVAPRDDFPVIGRSRVRKPIDDRPAWAINCFFVKKDHRGRGVSEHLIEGAIEYARERKAEILEAYPVVPGKSRTPDVFACPGVYSAFLKLGFEEVARRSETRPIMRYYLAGGSE